LQASPEEGELSPRARQELQAWCVERAISKHGPDSPLAAILAREFGLLVRFPEVPALPEGGAASLGQGVEEGCLLLGDLLPRGEVGPQFEPILNPISPPVNP